LRELPWNTHAPAALGHGYQASGGCRMDFFTDPRIVQAEARHSRRRKRAARVFGLVDGVFHLALLALVVLAILRFLEVVFPRVFGM
jgi:hypothetical protein